MSLDLPKDNYVPPHPQHGTPYHRYTILLLQNPGGTERVDIDVQKYLSQRDAFDVRAFCATYGFDLDRNGHGGGVFMWREVWNETVSDIYKMTLSKF